MAYTKQFKKMLWRYFLKAVGSYMVMLLTILGIVGVSSVFLYLFVSMLGTLFGLPEPIAIALAVVIWVGIVFVGLCFRIVWEESKGSAMFDAKNAGIQIEENKDD